MRKLSARHLPTVFSACWARHTMLLRGELVAFWVFITAFLPLLVGIIFVFHGLELRIFAHGFGVLAVKHLREPLAHSQHIRLLALEEVVPRREILKGCHCEALRTCESHEREAMLRCSLESLAAVEVNDDSLFQREALCLIYSERITRDNRKLFAGLARAFLDAHFGQDGYPLGLARIEGGAAVLRHVHDRGLGKHAGARMAGGSVAYYSGNTYRDKRRRPAALLEAKSFLICKHFFVTAILISANFFCACRNTRYSLFHPSWHGPASCMQQCIFKSF